MRAWTLLPALALLVTAANLARGQDPFVEARRYTEGSSRAALAEIEARIRTAGTSDRAELERELLAVLEDAAATPDARGWACRMLRIIGTSRSVPGLAAALGDSRVALDAVGALRGIPGSSADDALRRALGKASGAPQLAIIEALGSRRVEAAVPDLLRLVRTGPRQVTEAALHALGQVGTRAALLGLRDSKVARESAAARELALLAAAEAAVTRGERPLAGSTFRSLLNAGSSAAVRAAALRGLVRSHPAEGRSALLAALARGPEALRQAAAALIWHELDGSALPAVRNAFPNWPESARVAVLAQADRAWSTPIARAAMQDRSARVREAASLALSRLADVSSVGALLRAAAGKGAERAAAERAIATMPGAEVERQLRAVSLGGRPALERAAAARCLAARGGPSVAPFLLRLASAESPEVRAAALQALARLAGDSEIPGLLAMTVSAARPAERELAAHALGEAMRRCRDPRAALGALRQAYSTAGAAQRAALLRAAAQRDIPESLALLREAAEAADAVAADAAVQLLVEWPSTSVIPDLRRLAREARSRTHQVLALRGLIAQAGQPGALPREWAIGLLREAMGLAKGADDRRRVLSALMQVPHLEGLALALESVADPEVEVEAATAVSLLARALQVQDARAAGEALARLRAACKSPEARRIAAETTVALVGLVNIAPSGTADSPDDLEKDGDAHGDQAAIDGNLATYWDEADGAALYRLRVTFPVERAIRAISIIGFGHHSYAPRDFRVLCDGKEVAAVSGAEYLDNTLVVPLPPTTCRRVELVITRSYGGSPAIRELGIYEEAGSAAAERRVLVFSRTLGYRHANIPLGIAAIRALGQEHGFQVDATEESEAFTPENLARYRAVVLLSVTGDVLNEAQQEALKGYLEGGGGVAAIHGAIFGPSAMEENWKWYEEACGAAFKNHSGIVPATVRREDTRHPSTRELPDTWQRTDEWYNFASNPRPRVQVLLTLDEATYAGGEMGTDHPIAWCRRVGAGRFWYTAMGHTDESFSESLFLRHILGGILWAAEG